MSGYDDRLESARAELHAWLPNVRLGRSRSHLATLALRSASVAALSLLLAASFVVVDGALRQPPDSGPLVELPFALTDDPPSGMRLVSISNNGFDLEQFGEITYHGYERDGEEALSARAFVVAAGAEIGPASDDGEAIQTPTGFVYLSDEEVGGGFRSAAFEHDDGRWVVALSKALSDDELVDVVATSRFRNGDVVLDSIPERYGSVGELDLLALNGGPQAVYARIGASVSEVNVDRATVQVSTAPRNRGTTFFWELVSGPAESILVDGEPVRVYRQELGFGGVVRSVALPLDDDHLVLVSGTETSLEELAQAANGVYRPPVTEVATALVEVGSGFGTFGNPAFEREWSAEVLTMPGTTFESSEERTPRALVWLDNCEACAVLLSTFATAGEGLPGIDVVGVVSEGYDADALVDGPITVIADESFARSIGSVTFREPAVLLTDADGALVQTLVGPLSPELAEAVLLAFVELLSNS